MTTSLLLSILGLALVDSLNPSLFITQFYLLTTERPLPRILSYIGGVLVVNVSAGLIVLAGLQTVLASQIVHISTHMWRGLELIVGIILIVAGLWIRRNKTVEQTARKPRSLRPIHTFLLGVVITLQEVSTAAPYLVAVERISQASMTNAGNLFALAIYNAIYVTPLLIIVGTFLARGTQLMSHLEHINHTINIWLPHLFKYLCLVGGAALTIDATIFFAHGFLSFV